jgi:hypothetical protein
MNEKGTQIIKVNQRKDASCLEICLNNKKTVIISFLARGSKFCPPNSNVISTSFSHISDFYQPGVNLTKLFLA